MKNLITFAIVIASTFFSLPMFAQQTYWATDAAGNRIDTVTYYSLQSAQAAANAYDLRQRQQLTQTFTAKDENGNVIGTYATQAEAQAAANANYLQKHPAPVQGNTNQQPAVDPYLEQKKAFDLAKDAEALKAMKLQNTNSKVTLYNNVVTGVGNTAGTALYVGQTINQAFGGRVNPRNQVIRCQYCGVMCVGTQHMCTNQNYGGNGYVVPPHSGYNGSYCQSCHTTYYGGAHTCGGGYNPQPQGCFCTFYRNQGWVPNQYGTGTWCTWRMSSNGSGYGWFPSTQQGCGNQHNDGMFHTPIYNRFDNGGAVPGAQYGVHTY